MTRAHALALALLAGAFLAGLVAGQLLQACDETDLSALSPDPQE